MEELSRGAERGQRRSALPEQYLRFSKRPDAQNALWSSGEYLH